MRIRSWEQDRECRPGAVPARSRLAAQRKAQQREVVTGGSSLGQPRSRGSAGLRRREGASWAAGKRDRQDDRLDEPETEPQDPLRLTWMQHLRSRVNAQRDEASSSMERAPIAPPEYEIELSPDS